MQLQLQQLRDQVNQSQFATPIALGRVVHLTQSEGQMPGSPMHQSNGGSSAYQPASPELQRRLEINYPEHINFPDNKDQATASNTWNYKFQTPEEMDKANDKLKADEEAEDAKTSQNDTGPHFEPIVRLSEVEIRTGEEDEEAVFSESAKLYRWTQGQWKERGVGVIKILKHKETGKYRILMRRDQILKICCNHLIGKDLELQPMPKSDKAWIWHALDFSEEESKQEGFAIRFKTSELANSFKEKFTEGKEINIKLSGGTPVRASATAKVTSHKPAFTVDTLPKTTNSIVARGESKSSTSDVTIPKFSFAFPKPSAAAANLEAKIAGLPQKLVFTADQETKPESSNNDDDQNEDIHNESGDGPHFEPIVKLPDKVETKTGEEDEQVLYCHRVKLYKYIDKQWKEKGIGEMKILHNAGTKKSRIVMRRDQVLKLCANHYIIPEMKFSHLGNSDKAWTWTAVDHSDPDVEPKPEVLAVRFKTAEEASDFVKVVNQAKDILQGKDVSSLTTTVSFIKLSTQTTATTSSFKLSTVSTTTSQTTPQSIAQTQVSSTKGMLVVDKKAGAWNCSGCYALNEPTDSKCPCCGLPNPSAPKVEETKPSASTFAFGISSKPTGFSFGIPSTNASVSKPIFGNQQPVQSNSAKLSFGSTGYTFGQNKSTSATTMSSTSVFSIQTLEKSGTANPAATIPKPSHPQVSTTGVLKVTKRNGSWRCGSCYVENGQYDVNCKCCGQANPNATQAPGKDESSISQPLTTALPTTITDKSTFGFPGGATSFSDLIKSNTGGGFASSNKSGGWMGMPEQKPLFASMTQGGDDDDGTYPSEENADIHFEPIAKLPEKFKIVTGEEDEEELYSQRCKLYRFNKPTNEWKERGTGEIKLKRHIKNGRIRIVMRREQIFKVCANHYIRPDMKMDESKTSDRAWTWTAMDFSDNNEPTMEIFTVRFKNTDQTEKFKAKFDECQMMLLDVDPMTPCKARSMRSKELSDRAEKMKNESKFFKNKLSEQTNIQTENSDSSPTTHGPSVGGLLTAPIQQNARSLREKSEDVVKRSDDLILATPQKQLENSFALRGNKFSFQPKTDDNEKSPSRQHTTSADSNDPQAESDIQFEPIYQLPDHVEIITGEEDEQILFRNRAKLYMFHKETKQWKERGVGDIKILQHFSTYKVRVLMRREQVLKVCLNHFVQPEIKLSFKEQTSPKTLLWTATDFSDSEKPAGETLQFALRFENPDTASAFKNLWKEGAEADVAETLLEPDGSAINTTVKPGVTSSGAVAERPQRPVDQPKPTFSFANVPSPFDAATDEGPHEVMGFMFGSFAPQDFKFAFRYNTDNNQETTRRQQTLSAGSDGPQAKSYIYFKPFHQLPDYVEIRTGEEDEQILFRNRARLYMFRKETKQWKERGVGVIKILQHLSTLKSRILMRREQVLKVCLNHFVQSEIKLNFKEKTLHEVLLWTATDFSDSDKPTGETLQFALRFRNADIASTFKNQWEKSVEAAISETLLEPDESVIDTSTQRPRVTIPGMMVKNPQISIKQPKPKYRFTNVSSPLDVSTKYDEGTFEFMGYVFGKTAASKSTSTTDKFEYDISKISFNFDSDVTPQKN
ncbi:E3 SUMO-protein ligase RanBP2-like isoform X2 [Styela clava]